jgi:hypothetical protein
VSITHTYASNLTAQQAYDAVEEILSEDTPLPLSFGVDRNGILDGIKFRESGSGIDSETIALIVSIATPILTRFWDQWLLPEIRKRHGDDSIEDRQDPDAEKL